MSAEQLLLVPHVARRRRARLEHPREQSGSSDEWYTRWADFNAWHAEFRFTLDPCATAESAKCARYFTKEQNGLAQSWAGERVYCNPPYSTPNLAAWVEKCAQQAPFTPVLLLLVPAWTDRPWWQRHVEPGRRAGLLEVRFLPGRLRFGWPGAPDGSYKTGTFPSVQVIWRGGTP
jgi:phage N-6-adenine-methyltransferase